MQQTFQTLELKLENVCDNIQQKENTVPVMKVIARDKIGGRYNVIIVEKQATSVQSVQSTERNWDVDAEATETPGTRETRQNRL